MNTLHVVSPSVLAFALACASAPSEQPQTAAPAPAMETPADPEPAEPPGPLLEASVYDADGKAVELQALLRGHYSVLVTGCLT